MGVAVGDYDNDGFEDVYVNRARRQQALSQYGNGTFNRRHRNSRSRWQRLVHQRGVVDLDNDGLLDLVVLRYVQWDFDDVWCGEHKEGFRSYCHPDIFQPIAPLVFHNDGNGPFHGGQPEDWSVDTPARVSVSLSVIMITTAKSTSSSPTIPWSSFFITIKVMARLKRSACSRKSLSMGTAALCRAWAWTSPSYDNDGWPDLVVTDLANQRYALYKMMATQVTTRSGQPSLS